MKFSKIIIGKKVTLRELEESFFKEYHDQFSPTVRQFLHLPLTAAPEETYAFLQNQLPFVHEGKHLFYCIFDNHDKKLIGALEIREPTFVNGQFGAWVNEQYWGGGRYQEALDLMLNAYFTQTKETMIFAFIDVDNVRSIRAHQKYGFKIVNEFTMQANDSCCAGRKLYRLEYEYKGFRLPMKSAD